MKICIILPTYNEKQNLAILVQKILYIFKKNKLDGKIIIVDDASPDGTGQIACDLAKSAPKKIQVIHRPKKLGLGSAYIQGFKKALDDGADFIFEMDADLSHDPKEIPNFLKEARQADLVLGSRYIKGGKIVNWNLGRRLVSRLGNLYAKSILKLPISDLTSGYKCFKRRTLELLNLKNIRSDGYSFQIELTYLANKQGFKIKEIPITFTERSNGKSKFSKKIFWEAAWRVWTMKAT